MPCHRFRSQTSGSKPFIQSALGILQGKLTKLAKAFRWKIVSIAHGANRDYKAGTRQGGGK
jgi:hypothetical protein